MTKFVGLTRREFSRGLALTTPAFGARAQTRDREALIAAAKTEARIQLWLSGQHNRYESRRGAEGLARSAGPQVEGQNPVRRSAHNRRRAGEFHMTLDRFGRDRHESMTKQEPTFSRDYGEAVRRVSRGEFAIYAPLIFSQAGPLKGLPVKVVVPREGVTYGSYAFPPCATRRTPTPLLADFYLSDARVTTFRPRGSALVWKARRCRG